MARTNDTTTILIDCEDSTYASFFANLLAAIRPYIQQKQEDKAIHIFKEGIKEIKEKGEEGWEQTLVCYKDMIKILESSKINN